MSGQQMFSFPTIDALIKRFETDSAFATAVGTAFEEGITSAQLRATLEAAYDEVDESVLQSLTVALDEGMGISGIALPSVGPQALMVAVYCKNADLVVRYKLGSGGFLDMTRTPNSVACSGIG